MGQPDDGEPCAHIVTSEIVMIKCILFSFFIIPIMIASCNTICTYFIEILVAGIDEECGNVVIVDSQDHNGEGKGRENFKPAQLTLSQTAEGII